MTTKTTHTPIHIEHEGVLLRKVDRKAKDGDFVVFSEEITDAIPGKPYEITGGGTYADEDGDSMHVHGWSREPNPAIYEVVPQFKFKVGDKVIPSTLSAADRDYIGQTGTVTNAGSEYGGVEVLMSDGWTAIYKPKTLTLKVEEPIKSGDRVKILALSKYGKDYVGKFGIVEEVNVFGTGYISVDPEEGGGNGMYLPEQLELAADTKIELKSEGETTLTNTFKVGDKVKVLNAANGRYEDLRDGDIGIIEDISTAYPEMYRVSTDDDYDRFKAKDIELVPTFKKGDKVRMISTSPYYQFGNVKTGDIGTVDSVGSTTMYVAFEAQQDWQGKFDEFELVADERKFKAGDRVAVSNHPYSMKDGTEGTVSDEAQGGHRGDYRVDVDVMASSVPIGFYENELTLAPKFKEGDKVRVLDASAGRFGDQQTGAIGDISNYHEGSETYRVNINGDFDRYSASALELFVDEFEQFQPGDKVIVVSGGGNHPLHGFENGKEYEVVSNDVPRSIGRMIKIEKEHGFGGYALPSQLQKVEKVVGAPSAEKFSVGDYIRILEGDAIDGGHDLTDGKEYEITFVDSDGDIRVKDDVEESLCILRREFGAIEKVDAPAPAEDEPIKKGDFVKITGRIDGHDNLTHGEVYEVTGLNDPGFYILDDSGVRAYVGGYESDSYEKVDAPAPEAPALKVGDTVKIVDLEGTSAEGFYVGDIVEIIGNGVGGRNEFTISKGAINEGYVSTRHLEAYTPTAQSLKVGDYITIDFSLGEDADFNYIDLTEGKAYKVYENHRGELAFKDDVNDQRTAQIKQGAYTIVEGPTPTPAKAPPVATRGFQLGDIVRIDLVDRSIGGSINSDGDIGEVTELLSGLARVKVSGRGDAGNFEIPRELTLLVAAENREDK